MYFNTNNTIVLRNFFTDICKCMFTPRHIIYIYIYERVFLLLWLFLLLFCYVENVYFDLTIWLRINFTLNCVLECCKANSYSVWGLWKSNKCHIFKLIQVWHNKIKILAYRSHKHFQNERYIFGLYMCSSNENSDSGKSMHMAKTSSFS